MSSPPQDGVTAPIVRTEPLGGSPLVQAALAGLLGDWYGVRPTSPDGWSDRAAVVLDASGVESALTALGPAFSATGAAEARLRRVASGRGIVVTTGQQPGLFGGPIYTWSKALSALALADEIEATTGIPTAPVFWAATDDADFAEASWTAVAVTGGAERLAIAPGAPVGVPMSTMPLGDVSAALGRFVHASGATIDTRPIEAVRDTYVSGATVGSAYVALLRRLFEPLGIPVLDAAHPAVATAMRPHLMRALDQATAVADALHERDQRIRHAGFEPQVTEVAGLSLVFERVGPGGEKRRVPLASAAALASVDPVAGGGRVLSPNVLLRPVLERAILPTVAYLAGPGELAYFAQSTAVAAALGLAPPLALPRWSVTILEPHVVRVLEQLGLSEAALAEPDAAEGMLARAALRGTAVESALATLRDEIHRGTVGLGTAIDSSGLTLPAAVAEGARRAMMHRLDRLERRVVAAAKRRDHDTMARVGTARGALFPFGVRQERALNFLPLLARHGPALLDLMQAGARAHARTLIGSEASAPA